MKLLTLFAITLFLTPVAIASPIEDMAKYYAPINSPSIVTCPNSESNALSVTEGEEYMVWAWMRTGGPDPRISIRSASDSGLIWVAHEDGILDNVESGSNATLLAHKNATNTFSASVSWVSTVTETVTLRCYDGSWSTSNHFTPQGTPLPSDAPNPVVWGDPTSFDTGIGGSAIQGYLFQNVSVDTEASILFNEISPSKTISDFSKTPQAIPASAITNFYLNMTPASSGGSKYVFLHEDCTAGSEPNLFTVSIGNFPARLIDTIFSNCNPGVGGESITAWRLGYYDIPKDDSEAIVWSVDTTGTSNAIWTLKVTGYGADPLHVSEEQSSSYGFSLSSGNVPTYSFASTDDYQATINITVKRCPSAITSSGSCRAGAPFSVISGAGFTSTIGGATYSVGTSNSQGLFSITGQSLLDRDIKVTLSSSGYATRAYTLSIPGTSPFFQDITLYLLPATTTATIETSAISITPDPGNFTVPEPAIFSYTKETPDILYWSVFKLSTHPNMVTNLYPITETTSSIRYPINGPTTNTTGFSNHIGQYFLVVTDGDKNLVTTVPFIIRDSNSNIAIPSYNDGLGSLMIEQVRALSLPKSVTDNTEEEAEPPRNRVLEASDWAYDSRWLIPNMYWPLIGVSVVAIVIATNRGVKK